MKEHKGIRSETWCLCALVAKNIELVIEKWLAIRKASSKNAFIYQGRKHGNYITLCF
jgi:hypothetical protein